jgi:hypothetical protein
MPLSGKSKFFTAEKMIRVFLLTTNMFPIFYLLINLAALCISFWAFIFTFNPNKGSTKAVTVVGTYVPIFFVRCAPLCPM